MPLLRDGTNRLLFPQRRRWGNSHAPLFSALYLTRSTSKRKERGVSKQLEDERTSKMLKQNYFGKKSGVNDFASREPGD